MSAMSKAEDNALKAFITDPSSGTVRATAARR